MLPSASLWRSATLRLALTYVAVFSLSVIALGVGSLVTLQRSLQGQLREQVDNEVAQLLGEYQDEGLEELRHDIAERIDTARSRRLLYAVRAPDGRTIFDPFAPLPQASGWYEHATRGGTPVLLRVAVLPDGFALVVAADLTPISEIRSALQRTFGLGLIATLLLGALGSVVVSRRYLARLAAFNQLASQVGSGALSARLPVAQTDDEFDQLARIVNQMLVRIEGLVGNVRRVSTNIAHDLRTPLGRIRQQLEAIRDTPQHDPAAVQAIVDQLDESLNTFASLLRIAEVESGARRGAFARVDLGDVMQRVVETYGPVAEDQGVTLVLRLDATEAHVEGDAALLVQALVNLVENALHHAQAQAITVSLTTQGERVVLSVADDGVGLTPPERALVTEPFYRGDGSRSTAGSGLGLSLVQAIIVLHNGQLLLDDNDPGLRVVVVLPAGRLGV